MITIMLNCLMLAVGKISEKEKFREVKISDLKYLESFTDYVYHINIYKYATVSLEDKVIVFGGSSDEADVDTVAQFYSVSGEYRWKQLGQGYLNPITQKYFSKFDP